MTVKIKMTGEGTGIWKHMTNKYINALDADKLTNYVYNKINNIRQHNYLLEYIGYMFRPVNRSSSGHQ